MPQDSSSAGIWVRIKLPGHGEANAYSVTIIVPFIPSWPLPQKLSQWKGNVPALSGVKRSVFTFPGRISIRSFKPGQSNPCNLSSPGWIVLTFFQLFGKRPWSYTNSDFSQLIWYWAKREHKYFVTIAWPPFSANWPGTVELIIIQKVGYPAISVSEFTKPFQQV